MSADGEGFLARWSRRKAGIAAPGDSQREAAAAPAPPPIDPKSAPAPSAGGAGETAAAPIASDATPAQPLPTLADVAALTRESDYTRFMAPGVDSSVRNAAMKALFRDPRFNVMDGLDIYIDDYNKPDPIPVEMLKKLRQSQLLGLFRDDIGAAAAPAAAAGAQASPDNAAAPPTAPAASEPPAPTIDDCRAEDDPDLRLQPDDDDRRSDAGEGARD